MANNIEMEKMIKKSFDHKVRQGNLTNPQFELIYHKYKDRALNAEASFLSKARINVQYAFYKSNKKAVFAAILCLVMLSLTMYGPSRVFAEQIIKKIYVVYEDDGAYKLKMEFTETNNSQTQTPLRVSDVPDLSDTEISERLGYKVVIPSELPGGYLLVSKTILQDGENEADLKEFVTAKYSKQNVDISKEAEFISLKITDLEWPLQGTVYTVDGTEYYYKEAGVAEYQTSYDEQGNMIVDQEKKPDGIDLVHTLAWKSDNVTYAIGDVGGRDLTREQLVEIAKPIVDGLIGK